MSMHHGPLVASLVALTVLLLTAGCHRVGQEREITWNVPEADHSVSATEVIETYGPALRAAAHTLETLDTTPAPSPGSDRSDRIETYNQTHDDVCAVNATLYPADTHLTHDDWDRAEQALAATVAPFGFDDLRRDVHPGGGLLLVAIADDGVMLEIAAKGPPTVTVRVPADPDQCEY